MPTEKEMRVVELAALYEFRLLVNASDKAEYTKEELLALIDQIAQAKNSAV